MKLTKNLKQDIVLKVKQSDTFKNAPTSMALLQYLFDATSNGEQLKESIIDIEFFRSNNTSDKTTPRVRVNVYNLRKKINQYYNLEGKDDVWRLAIDKGQYKIRFYKQASKNYFKKLSLQNALLYSALAVALSIIIMTNIPKKKPRIWKSFLSKNAQTNLYIGDHFGVTGKTITQNNGWTRDFSINSSAEFYEFMDNNPRLRDSLKPSSYSYSTRMAALATQKFQSFFQSFDEKFSVRFSTQTSTSEIKEGNAIYAGPSKNNNQFLYFFNASNPYFEISGTQLKLINHSMQKDTIFSLNSGDATHEYAVVSKYPVDNNEHLVFFSQHDIGVSATVEYFTNLDSIQKFQKTFLSKNKYFTSIFEVRGQDRTNTSLKLVKVITFD